MTKYQIYIGVFDNNSEHVIESIPGDELEFENDQSALEYFLENKKNVLEKAKIKNRDLGRHYLMMFNDVDGNRTIQTDSGNFQF